MSTRVTTTISATGPGRATSPSLGILALATGGFAIGTTEFMVMGLLPQIADGVGVSIPTAGHLISAYALAVAGLLTLLASARAHRRGAARAA